MSTVEDFENAPVGATATTGLGSRAMKMIDDGEQRWITPSGNRYNDESMVQWGYTLDVPAPTTAREALDLAWELAHEVKEGQVIPKGTHILRLVEGQVRVFQNSWDFDEIDPLELPSMRTLAPLPDPEPDWLDSPAVLARLKTWIPSATPRVFARYEHDHGYWLTIDPPAHHWSELENVTPLYPKEQA